MGLRADEGKIGSQQGHPCRPHLDRQIHRRMQNAAAGKQLAPRQQRPHLVILRAGRIGAITHALPGREHLGIDHREIDQANRLALLRQQDAALDVDISRDDEIGPNALFAQRPVGGIDADEQRRLRLGHPLPQAFIVTGQGRSRRNNQSLAARTRAKQLGYISILCQQGMIAADPLTPVRLGWVELTIDIGQLDLSYQAIA